MINKKKIRAIAEADFNELLLMQEKDFDKESKEYAMELYFKQIDTETLASIMHAKKNKEYREKHWYFYEH